jgi:hypothetical protein
MQESSRVWIYQSNREFSEKEMVNLRNELNSFSKSWVSHSQLLTATTDVLYCRFIVLIVDESYVGAGGCSIDTSVAFLHQLEARYSVNLFDRLTFAWLENDEVKTAPKEEFALLFQKGLINDETLVFDNLVRTKAELESEWLKPLAKSWHKKIL